MNLKQKERKKENGGGWVGAGGGGGGEIRRLNPSDFGFTCRAVVDLSIASAR